MSEIFDYLFHILGRFAMYSLAKIGFKIDLDENSNSEESILALAGLLVFCLLIFVFYLGWSCAKDW